MNIKNKIKSMNETLCAMNEEDRTISKIITLVKYIEDNQKDNTKIYDKDISLIISGDKNESLVCSQFLGAMFPDQQLLDITYFIYGESYSDYSIISYSDFTNRMEDESFVPDLHGTNIKIDKLKYFNLGFYAEIKN